MAKIYLYRTAVDRIRQVQVRSYDHLFTMTAKRNRNRILVLFTGSKNQLSTSWHSKYLNCLHYSKNPHIRNCSMNFLS